MLVLIVVYVFKGEECLAAHCQCSNRGVMPFAHWRVSPPPQKEEGRLACATIQGRSPLACWRVLQQERECECIAACCQHSNGGAIFPCMLEVSSTRVVGRSTVQHVASAAIQRQSIVVCVLLNFWIFFHF